jgi:hypothetical protein
MNLLAIVRAACAELSLPQPSAVVGATDQTAVLMLALANSEGRDLSRRYAWQALTREATFTTVAAESQGTLAGIVSGQLVRYIVNDTIWNRTTGEPVLGPRAGTIWQGYKAVTFSSPLNEYRIRGNELLFIPTPTAGHTCAFEYVSRYWCTDVTGATYRDAFAADTDLALIDDELLLSGLLWRWRKAKGFDYAEEHMHHERQVADAMARDGTKPILDMAGPMDHGLPVAIGRVIGT